MCAHTDPSDVSNRALGNPSLSPAGVPTSPHQGSSSHPVLWFVLRRTATGIATLFVISILIFLATNVLPGNAAEVIESGGGAHAELRNVCAIRRTNHKDARPFYAAAKITRG